MNVIILAILLLGVYLMANSSNYVVTQETVNRVLTFTNVAREASQRFGIPLARILSIIAVESKGIFPTSVGSAGEHGLMQIKPAAFADAKRYANLNYNYDALGNDSQKEIESGAAYYAWLLFIMKDSELAIRAYNQGIGTIQKNSYNEKAIIYSNAVKGYEHAFKGVFTS